MSTRILVKNIPKHMTETRLRTHFGSTGATVTDAKIIRTRDGRSRLFAFVGFQTATEARKAVNHFNNTFIDTSRITVEPAKPVGDESLGRPWSRYSKGSSLYMRAHPQEAAALRQQEREKAKQQAQQAAEAGGADKAGDDGQSAEDKDQMARFLAAMHVSQEEIQAKKAARGGAAVRPEIVLPGSSGEGSGAEDSKKKKAKKDEDALYKSQGDGTRVVKQTVKSKMFGSAGMPLQKTHIKFDDSDDDDDEEEDDDEKKNGEATEKKDEAGKVVGISKRDAGMKEPARGAGAAAAAAAVAAMADDDDGALGEEAELAVVAAQMRAEQAQWEEGRLFVRNISYATTEKDLEGRFSEFGPIREVHVPLDKQTGKNKGFAFVLFVNAADAVKAFSALDGAVLQGRLLHIIPARAAPHDARRLAQEADARRGGAPGSSQFKEAAAKQRALAQNPFNWNALFLRQDAVADAMSSKLDVKKSELLDHDSSNLAVRMALSEAHVVAETKKSLEEQGVNVAALEQGPMAVRSSTVFMVKNLPAQTNPAELAALFEPFGTVVRLVMPPSCALAIVEMANSNEARNAFRGMAYRRFRHVPIFLEWAPVDVFTSPAPPPKTEKDDEQHEQEQEEQKKKDGEEGEEVGNKTHAVYVKNVNFDSTEESLRAGFEKVCGKYATIRRVTIPRRTDAARRDASGRPAKLSMGFAFVEYATEAEARQAAKLMDGKVVDGHALQVSLSRPVAAAPEGSSDAAKHLARRAATADAAARAPKSAKLMVRNVPFEATKKELRDVFAPFAQIKSIRVPKRADGRARGFAFVEFLTKQEAAAAMEALKDVHFYGRHLVLEYSTTANNGPEEEDEEEEEGDENNSSTAAARRARDDSSTGGAGAPGAKQARK